MPSKISQELKELRQRPRRFWHYYYKRHRRNNGISAKQILVGQIVGVGLSLIAGVFLEDLKASFVIIPGTLLLLPGLIDVISSIVASLTVKLNHHLEKTDFSSLSIVLHDSWYSLVVLGISSAFVGLFAGVIGIIFFEAKPLELVTLSFTTASIIGLVMFPVVSLAVILARKVKLNPDELIGPIETSIVDMLVIVVLSMVIGWIA